MKVVVNDKIYVQVRDIIFLARLYKNKVLMNYYLSLINQGFGDNDFVKANNKLLNKLLASDIIIDFNECKDYSDYHLSSLIITLTLTSNGISEVLEHKIDDLRDMISLKRNELGYSIPLIPDDKINEVYDDLNGCFKSTIFSDYYVIESLNGEEVGDTQELLKRGLKYLHDKGLIREDVKYHVISKGSYVVLCIEKKKEVTILDKITKKFKNKTSQ